MAVKSPGFCELLSPLSPLDFQEKFISKTFFHLPAGSKQLHGLLPWETLNAILAEHRLDYPRLRLIRNGETLPPASYLEYLTDRRGARYPRVNVEGLEKELNAGAMLHFAALDEIHEPVRGLAQEIEKCLKTKVTVNICAGIANSRGFATHWDGHDVIVAQIHGTKRWRVYGITEEAPLRIGYGMDLDRSAKPTQPVWEGVLEEGDLLYMPRGCWHSAEGTATPTLHLTIGLINPTGYDFLQWLAKNSLSSGALRRDIPQLEGPNAQTLYARQLKEILEHRITQKSLAEFLHAFHTATPRTAKPSLPLNNKQEKLCKTQQRQIQPKAPAEQLTN